MRLPILRGAGDKLASSNIAIRTILVAALVASLFAGIFALRSVDSSSVDSMLLLFVIPIAISSLAFGARGGVPAALLGIGLVFLWDQASDLDLGLIAYATRTIVFLLVGGLLGWFVTARNRLVECARRSEEVSLDMQATAGFDGYYRRLNPAWERTLGHSLQELMSRPFIEFVHPDDRAKTVAEQAKLVSNTGLTLSFRNRYLAADGSYRWLEWNARCVPQDALIYAAARDVTAQQHAEVAIRDHAVRLERTVQERTTALEDARLENLTRLALAAEYRDDETHQHTERVGCLSERLARQLGLDERQIVAIGRAAPLHDLGKIGIPDHILLKPGRLTAEEFELMRSHTEIGAAILSGSNAPFLQMGEQIAISHHERWDGFGYPRGLRGEEIPIAGRIVAVADAFDAMVHSRPYRDAISTAEAIAELERCSGSQFDPRVVEAFAALGSQSLVAA